MTFLEINARLLDYLRNRVRNGDYTERGLARVLGLSQSHLHKALRGANTFSSENVDWILRSFHITILDLVTETELTTHLAKLRTAERSMVEVPFARGSLGPGGDWQNGAAGADKRLVPCQHMDRSGRTLAARLTLEDEMLYGRQGHNLAIVCMGHTGAFSPVSLYVIRDGDDALIRRVRPGTRDLYVVPDESADAPLQWKQKTSDDVLGRVLWTGHDESGADPVQSGACGGTGRPYEPVHP